MFRKYLIIIILLLPNLACAQQNQSTSQQRPQLYWTKPSYTQQAFNSDKYECLQSSIAQSQPNNSIVMPDMNSSMMQMMNQNNLFSACLQAKGYSLLPANSPAAAPLKNSQPSNEENAYCLQVYKITLISQEDSFDSDNDPTHTAGDEAVLNITKSTINSIKETLASNGLYSFESDKISPNLEPSMKQARIDNHIIMHDKHHECSAPCLTMDFSAAGMEHSASCYKVCNKYLSAIDRKYFHCFELMTGIKAN